LKSPQRYTIPISLLIILFFIFDIATDVIEGELKIHIIIELFVFSLATWLLIHEIKLYSKVHSAYKDERDRVQRLSGELQNIIVERFTSWKLTPSETEIAWMLLKGYTFSEIADARNTKEKTVRQQATSLYAKSTCKNRAEFVALFMEDLLIGTDSKD
jgi:DNA-binding CsgD family transcriptional regulator